MPGLCLETVAVKIACITRPFAQCKTAHTAHGVTYAGMAFPWFLLVASALCMASVGAMMDDSASMLAKAMKTMTASDFTYRPPAKNEVSARAWTACVMA